MPACPLNPLFEFHVGNLGVPEVRTRQSQRGSCFLRFSETRWNREYVFPAARRSFEMNETPPFHSFVSSWELAENSVRKRKNKTFAVPGPGKHVSDGFASTSVPCLSTPTWPAVKATCRGLFQPSTRHGRVVVVQPETAGLKDDAGPAPSRPAL